MQSKQATSDYVLGIDLGASSIGWALVREKAILGASDNIIAGVRIFQPGTASEKNVESSKTADRRNARGMRRQHKRRTMRRNTLRFMLMKFNLWPQDALEQKQLIAGNVGEDGKCDPLQTYKLRAKALDEPLSPYEFGRALLHLSQRRGFKSNRKTDGGKDTGTVKDGIKVVSNVLQGTGARTLGELYAKYIGVTVGEKEKETRTKDADGQFQKTTTMIPVCVERRRTNYTARDMVREEFEKIWEAQAQYNPTLLTTLAKKKIEDAIFFQRPFDKGSEDKIGPCTYLPGEERARLGHRLVQRYRIWQELANLRFNAHTGEGEQPLDAITRKVLFELLDKKEEIKFAKIKKELKLDESGTFNLESKGKRGFIKGNESEYKLIKAFGSAWVKLTEDERNARCEAVLNLPDDELDAKARNEWRLSGETLEKVSALKLTDRPGNVSLAAIKRLLPHLELGATLHDALEKEQLGMRHIDTSTGADQLPMPDAENMDGQQVTNPVVRKSLYQVRKLVNAIIRKYGKPKSICVEMARDTRGSIQERNERNTENFQHRERNEKHKVTMKDTHGLVDPSGRDVIKMRLWDECSRMCPYCGIPLTDKMVFQTGEAQIEHIVPFSFSLDDSFGNKTLSCAKCNLEKSAQTPYQTWGSDETRWGEIMERVRRFKSEFCGKKIRLFERKEIDPNKAPERLLNDTRYICKQVRAYLQKLYPGTGPERDQFVRVCTGSLTAALRHQWGMNNILAEDNKKERGDHRHHAIDAIVIALTNYKQIKCLSDWSAEDRRNRYAGQDKKPILGPPLPYITLSGDPEKARDSFRAEAKAVIDQILISHRPTRRARGQMHEETNYGALSPDKPNMYVVRKPLLNITASEATAIIDKRIKALVLDRIRSFGIDPTAKSVKMKNKDIFAEPLYMSTDGKPNGKAQKIVKVRIEVPGNGLVPFKNDDGEVYRYVMPGNNHHIEVFEFTDAKGKLKREARTVTMFEVRRRIVNREPIVCRTHPTRPEAKLYTWFCKNDMLYVKDKDGKEQLCRVQKMSGTAEPSSSFNVVFRDHRAARIDDDSKMLNPRNCQPGGLEVRKVCISPLGEEQKDNS